MSPSFSEIWVLHIRFETSASIYISAIVMPIIYYYQVKKVNCRFKCENPVPIIRNGNADGLKYWVINPIGYVLS